MSQRLSRGFTLLELLVVIGIIAVLLGIMIPVLARSRDVANTTVCLSNLRQLGAAIMTYSHDNKGAIVPSLYWTPESKTNSSRWQQVNYATILVDGRYLPAPDQKDSPANGSVGYSAFRCPSGSDMRAMNLPSDPSTSADSAFVLTGQGDGAGSMFWRTTSPQTGVVVDTWYGANGAYIYTDRDQYPMRAFAPGDFASAAYGSPHKLTDLKGSANWALLYDGVYVHNEKSERINLRHRQRKAANVMLADGHGETVEIGGLPVFPNGLKASAAVNSAGGTSTTAASGCALPTRNHWRLDE